MSIIIVGVGNADFEGELILLVFFCLLPRTHGIYKIDCPHGQQNGRYCLLQIKFLEIYLWFHVQSVQTNTIVIHYLDLGTNYLWC